MLIGPTGSGKTPLGEHLARHGLNGKRCWHFDFGANLRSIITTKEQSSQRIIWNEEDIGFIKNVLESGALLEDKDFPLARKILESFIQRHSITDNDIIVLNGLPRHVGQAKAMMEFVDVNVVVHLSAAPEVLSERIRTNAGGDRVGRTDDNLDDIGKKIAIFNVRTTPLISHYRAVGAKVLDVNVDLDTKVESVYSRLTQ